MGFTVASSYSKENGETPEVGVTCSLVTHGLLGLLSNSNFFNFVTIESRQLLINMAKVEPPVIFAVGLVSF